jgi:hypothetical protein
MLGALRSLAGAVMQQNTSSSALWPALPYQAWADEYATLHLWLQIVGKIRLALCPWVNHSWHVALRVTASGLTTQLMATGAASLQIDFDFVEHQLVIRMTDGRVVQLPLEPQTTASFYRAVMDALASLGVRLRIRTMPSELPNPIPFDRDDVHAAYDPDYADRYWRVLLSVQSVFETFRARFIGKCSPVHFFWGAADLAVTRFSGRTAPPHPGGVPNLPDWVAREAYSHEVSSAGFWAGGPQYPQAVFYSYAYPEPPGFAKAPARPGGAHYSAELREFVLPYEDVRLAASPEGALLEFLQSTYEAAAECADWDRVALERDDERERKAPR